MASPLSKSELLKLIENCEAIKKSYPENHPQHARIEEQIKEYRVKLELIKK